MEIIWKDITIRQQNELVDLIKNGEPVILIVNNTTKQLQSFLKFMNRLKKSNIEMNIRMLLK